MGRIKLKLKNWPFEKGQKVQLIWIGEPFKENNKWMIDTYFCDGKVTKKVIQDWTNIHFLSIDKYYTDGDLNSGKIIDDEGIMKTMNIDLSNIMPKYNESDWNIKKSNYKSKSRTFSFWKHNVLYTIPIIEIVRAVLAPNSFMLNTILYNDIWEDYFTYKIEDRNLYIYFTSQYKRSHLKNEYYNHLAWVISNDEILKMCNDIGYNMFSQGNLRFDFNMTNFNIKARVKKNKHGFTIMEIVKMNLKQIKIDEIDIYHPSFEELKKSNQAKLRTYTYLNKNTDDRIVDNKTDGANNFDESIDEKLITHEYINIPKVKKEKARIGNLRTDEDNNTKKYILEDNTLRTTGDSGGPKVARGLQFANISEIKEQGELKEFIQVLRLLEKRNDIRSVEIIIGELPPGRKFSILSDGITKRKYAIGKLVMSDDTECSLIEVERDGNVLSTLILKVNILVNWERIYSILLLELVNKSGKWSNSIIKKFIKMGITVIRNKHIQKDINEKEEQIYKKIM